MSSTSAGTMGNRLGFPNRLTMQILQLQLQLPAAFRSDSDHESESHSAPDSEPQSGADSNSDVETPPPLPAQNHSAGPHNEHCCAYKVSQNSSLLTAKKADRASKLVYPMCKIKPEGFPCMKTFNRHMNVKHSIVNISSDTAKAAALEFIGMMFHSGFYKKLPRLLIEQQIPILVRIIENHTRGQDFTDGDFRRCLAWLYQHPLPILTKQQQRADQQVFQKHFWEYILNDPHQQQQIVSQACDALRIFYPDIQPWPFRTVPPELAQKDPGDRWEKTRCLLSSADPTTRKGEQLKSYPCKGSLESETTFNNGSVTQKFKFHKAIWVLLACTVVSVQDICDL